MNSIDSATLYTSLIYANFTLYIQILSHQTNETQPKIVANSITDIAEDSCEGCAPFSSEQRTLELVVPPLTFPTDLTSRICRIEYAIVVSKCA